MSEDFKIELEWLESSDREPVEKCTFAQIQINAAQQVATELEDLFAKTVRHGVRASAYDLALWFAENWWRLRWEPQERSVDWRLSHVMAAIGGGVAWPDLSFASDGLHVLVEGRKTSGELGAPVRYLRDLDIQVSAGPFEAGVDDFVQRVLARLAAVNFGATDLGRLWEQLLAERQDQQIGAHRRLEALLGFDPDEAPDPLITSLQARTNEAGHGAIEEIAAAAKVRSPEMLGDILESARRSGVAMRVAGVSNILHQYLEQRPQAELPWQRARRAAMLARDIWGVREGLVSNEKLSELFGVPQDFLEYNPANGLRLAAGLRTDQADEVVNVVIRAKVQPGRRFELMRLVADHIAAPHDDRLLPATAAKTDRQKFQRGFAQEFLLPFDELYRLLGEPRPGESEISDSDIEDVAEEYDVSPLLVRTVLVNKGFLPRDLLIAA